MPQVEIDDDLYEYLQRHKELSGESFNDRLRRALAREHDRPEDAAIRSRTNLAEFLDILTDVHRRYGDRFVNVASVRGRTRIYFATTPGEIEQSGSSTAPVEIPGTGWWVSSNNAKALRRGILRKVFGAVRCSAADREKWLEQFDRAGDASSDDYEWQPDANHQEPKI